MPTGDQTTVRHTFLDTADTAVDLLDHPSVAAKWDAPSALPRLSVAGLAGHTARQILHVPRLLAADQPDEPPITVLEHYRRATWTDADLDDEANVAIRRDADAEAAGGAAALVTQTRTALDGLRAVLPAQPADRVVHLAWGPWSLSLDDFLVTRMLELVVHCDDLAVSVDAETPPLPQPAVDRVVALLAQLAVRRHGTAAVVRGLSRAERAPATITAF